MSISAKQVKVAPPIEIDPNFFLPPDVVDMRYKEPDEENDSALVRDESTGEVVSVDYDEVGVSDIDGSESGGSDSDALFPPDYVTVVSQEVRVTGDGKFVVDVILDVEDIQGVIQYDVRLTKP
jgi:hypothetical protein